MNVPDRPAAATTVFADRPFTATQHFKLSLLGVIATVIEAVADGDIDAAVESAPFLADYLEELGRDIDLDADRTLASRWRAALTGWERAAELARAHLPLLALRRAGLSELEVALLLAVGLIEEDPRFGALFEAVQRQSGRPSFGLLMAWWRNDGEGGDDRIDQVRRSLQRLIDDGLLQLTNPDAPRPDWIPAVALMVWDGLRGEAPSTRAFRYMPWADLARLDDYIPPVATLRTDAILDALRLSGSATALLIRGPIRNGRKTLAAALAHSLGKSLLVASDAVFEDEARWRLFGVLAAMHDAVPVAEASLLPGETRTLPALSLVDAPLIVITGRHGAWSCAGGRSVLEIDLPLPGPAQRLQHWSASLPGQSPEILTAFSSQVRLSSGHIRQVAVAARGFGRLAQRDGPLGDALSGEDLRRACRGLQTARLETLATRLEPGGHLRDLVVDEPTRVEIDALIARCRWREPLACESAEVAMNGVGVRALFAGPSGTGKTLTAKLIAAELGKELYRIDLSAAVNKYLGETEKNLNNALNAAEELDVVLLLDEGDALMANRTDVGSSNDRYANLETNFLLQRIEAFEGILVVTSNAADRIDRAFARRMDVVVNFRAPDAWRRYEIMRLHLAGDDCDDAWLQQAATRCALSGGQLRNVVMHARLLALQSGAVLDAGHLQDALVREYRKNGASCPMRPLEQRLRIASGP